MKLKEKLFYEYAFNKNRFGSALLPLVGHAYSQGFEDCKFLLLEYFEPRDPYNPQKTFDPKEIEELGEEEI